MKDGNNGAYANDWLLADRKNNEIARVELGLKHVAVDRTSDGYFIGSNFPVKDDLIHDETTFKVDDASSSPNARRKRWEQVMQQNKGKINVELARDFMSDHEDTFDNRKQADVHTLCGHGDVYPKPETSWGNEPFNPSGAVNGKAADSAMAEKMSFYARIGHPCGENFAAAPFLAKHPEFKWQKSSLHDMIAGPWTLFTSADRETSSKP